MDALAAAGGQQVLSPYHAMGCNPALMVDPFGLQSGKSDPRPPGSLLTGGNVPGSSGWGAITGYYRSMLGSQARPAELQGMLGAMAMMRILSGDAAGAASRMSPGGGSAMSSYEQMVQQNNWKRQWKAVVQQRRENGDFWDGILTPDGVNYYILTDEGDLNPIDIENHLEQATVEGRYLVQSIYQQNSGAQQASAGSGLALTAAQILFNEIVVPIALAEPTPFGEAFVVLVNAGFLVYNLHQNTHTLNYEEGDDIGLERFTQRLRKGVLRDPKSKEYLEPDDGRNSGGGENGSKHGGSWWKLYSKQEERIGTITKEGIWLRK